METSAFTTKNISDNGIDLDAMRTQLSLLKKKLDKQTIVTDRLINRAMKQQMSWIDKYLWFASLVLLPAVCVLWWQAKAMLGLSMCSYLLLVLLTAGSVVADIVINKMCPSDWQSDNLVQTAHKLARMKHTRKVQTQVQCALLVVVLAFISYDACTAGVLPRHARLIFGISMAAGLVVGGGIGLVVLARMQRTNDDIIKQIEELTAEQQ